VIVVSDASATGKSPRCARRAGYDELACVRDWERFD
jgi:hypothetical protein